MSANTKAPDSCPVCGGTDGIERRIYRETTIDRLTRERDLAREALERYEARVKRLEEAGEFLDDVADAADDDIREHLQVANYNLHGLMNTGERIKPPNPPQTIHQAGIDASVAVREDIRKARNFWKEAKEAKP